MTADPRKPRVYRLEAPLAPEADTVPARAGGKQVTVALEGDAFAKGAAETGADGSDPPILAARPSRWSILGTLFWSALTGLVGLALSVALWQLIDDLFAKHAALGWVGVALTAVMVLAVLGLVTRELRAIFRLRAAETLRADALRAVETDDGALAKMVVTRLMALQASDPATAANRARMQDALGSIVDGKALMALAERTLMEPRDALAQAAIASAAKRVSMVTALSPRALVDILFVGAQSVMLMRRIAVIYGARPGALGFWRLGRRILGHLAITGGVALTDSVVSQMVGHGLAARLSAKLGEGVLNGLLTARVGLACIAVCRPLPFVSISEPRLQDVAGEILSDPLGRKA